MKDFKRGTPAFGFLAGCIFVILGILLMTIGFWKTVLLMVLFAVGYFLGAVNNKGAFLKDTVNRIVPEKKSITIDMRETLNREQAEAYSAWKQETEKTSEDADSSDHPSETSKNNEE